MSRNKLYIIVFIACMIGFIWLWFSQSQWQSEKGLPLCFIKHTTGIPCPSCGTTRSIQSLSNGDISTAFWINPLGILSALIMLISPLWISFDVLTRKDSFYRFYRQMEVRLRMKWVAWPLIVLVLLNWFWNIKKGL